IMVGYRLHPGYQLFAVFPSCPPARASTPIDVVRARDRRPCSASDPTGRHDGADPHVRVCRHGRAEASVGLLNAQAQLLRVWKTSRLPQTSGSTDQPDSTMGLATVGY